MAPSTSPAPRIGKQKAVCRPARAVARRRGKLTSAAMSAIQAGSRLDHTRPGRPSPGASDVLRLARSNGSGPCHVSTQLSVPSPPTGLHSAPTSQPSAVPIAASSRG